MGENGGNWEIVFCTGTFERALDDKHRLLVPKTVKKTLQEALSVYLTPGFDQCLELHNTDSMVLRGEEITRCPTGQRNTKSLSRLFFAQTENCELDSQGRIRIPQRLIEWSQLETRVVIVGVGRHWEIWNEELWRSYCLKYKPDFDELAEALTVTPQVHHADSKQEIELPHNPR